MRLFKLISVIVVATAFSALAVATASAAETLWKCEGGEATGLKGSLDEGKTSFTALEQAEEGVIEFDMTKDKEGEEIVEE